MLLEEIQIAEIKCIMTSTEIDALVMASIDFRFLTCTPFQCLRLWYIV